MVDMGVIEVIVAAVAGAGVLVLDAGVRGTIGIEEIVTEIIVVVEDMRGLRGREMVVGEGVVRGDAVGALLGMLGKEVRSVERGLNNGTEKRRRSSNGMFPFCLVMFIFELMLCSSGRRLGCGFGSCIFG